MLSTQLRKLLLTCSCAVVCGALLTTAFIYGRDDRLLIVERQIAAIQNGDIADAYGKYTTRNFRTATPLETFYIFLDSHAALRHKQLGDLAIVDSTDDHATLHANLAADKSPAEQVEFKLNREDGQWRIASITCLTEHNERDVSANIEEVRRPVDMQLKAIQDGNYTKAYYDNVSIDFQNTTPLDEFEAFVKAHPELSKYSHSDIINSNINGKYAVITVKLTTPSNELPLEYQLQRIDGSWYIRGIKVPQNFFPEQSSSADVPNSTSHAAAEPLAALANNLVYAPSAMTPMSNPQQASGQNNATLIVEQMLNALRNNTPAQAYAAYTSRGFQEINSLDTFVNFANSYPVLKNTIPKLTYYGNTADGYASISAEFHEANGTSTLNSLMIDEGGHWKILAMDIAVPKLFAVPQGILTTAVPTNNDTPAPASSSAATAIPQLKIDLTQEKDKLKLVAERFLASLRHADFSAAYKYYMSDDFQKITPYEKFQQTLQRLPTLAQGQATLENPEILDNNHGKLTAKLSGPHGRATLTFLFLKVGSDWKIHSLEITGTSSPQELSSAGSKVQSVPEKYLAELDPTSPTYPIQNQLSMLNRGEVANSYLEWTSAEFQRTTTLDEYKVFISHYPIFRKHNDYSITTDNAHDNSAAFKVVLMGDNGEQASLIYDTTRQEGAWKILNIELSNYKAPPKGLSPLHPKQIPLIPETATTPAAAAVSTPSSPLAQPSALPSSHALTPIPDAPSEQSTSIQMGASQDASSQIKFISGVFGTNVDPTTGMITTPTLTIPKGKDSIYFNLYVENGKSGTPITLDFQHLQSGVTIPKIASTLKTDGASTMSYIFAPPPAGWPEGIYQLAVTADSEQQTFTFRVQ